MSEESRENLSVLIWVFMGRAVRGCWDSGARSEADEMSRMRRGEMLDLDDCSYVLDRNLRRRGEEVGGLCDEEPVAEYVVGGLSSERGRGRCSARTV